MKWKTQVEGDYLNSFETGNASTFQHTITGLSAGVYYDIVVQARNVVGLGQASLPTRLVAAVAPAPPSLLQVIAQSSTEITVGWVAVTGSATGGSPITSYEVFWKTATDQHWSLAAQTTSATTQVSKAVSIPGTIFNVKIVALNDAGRSSDSAVLELDAVDSPSVMQMPFKLYADETTVSIGWQEPTDSGYSEIVGYKVYWNAATHLNLLPEPVFDTQSAGILSFTTSDVVTGSQYIFAVTAYNKIHESAKSPFLVIIAGTVPSQPEEPRRFASQMNGITI